MKLSEAIEFLTELKEDKGDVDIQVLNDDGDPADNLDIRISSIMDDGKVKECWVIYGW